jgi:hypothetical protein
MGLKEQLIKNKEDNEEIKYEIAEYQSALSYQLGYSNTKIEEVDWSEFFDPFIKQFADLNLKLQNGTSDNPVMARKYVDAISTSVEAISNSITNIASNTEVWGEAMQKAGLMGGLDLMGTPISRVKALTILNEDLSGKTDVVAVDGNIENLAWEIYDESGYFVERLFINKLNALSETQDMFITIPDTFQQNQALKKSIPEIFEVKQLGAEPENQVLTGGVTEVYRKKTKTGELEIKTKDLDNNMVQDFYIIDKETVGESLQFITEIDKITAGMLGAYESSDQVIAFNNNILSEVTDHYIKPGKALREKEQLKFQEDYKEWYLEKEIGNEFPLGEPRLKGASVEIEATEEQLPDGQEEVQVEEQIQS